MFKVRTIFLRLWTPNGRCKKIRPDERHIHVLKYIVKVSKTNNMSIILLVQYMMMYTHNTRTNSQQNAIPKQSGISKTTNTRDTRALWVIN